MQVWFPSYIKTCHRYCDHTSLFVHAELPPTRNDWKLTVIAAFQVWHVLLQTVRIKLTTPCQLWTKPVMHGGQDKKRNWFPSAEKKRKKNRCFPQHRANTDAAKEDPVTSWTFNQPTAMEAHESKTGQQVSHTIRRLWFIMPGTEEPVRKDKKQTQIHLGNTSPVWVPVKTVKPTISHSLQILPPEQIPPLSLRINRINQAEAWLKFNSPVSSSC